MNILIAHNFYASSVPSGENLVVDLEKRLLMSKGHAVENFHRHSDVIHSEGGLGVIKGALSTPWNPWVESKIKKLLDIFAPNIVHVHNTFPLISPSIFHAIGKRAARVLTLHNYRLVCPAAIPMRNGQVCTECIDSKSVFPSLKHGCYRGSRIATAPLAANVALHRRLGTWQHQVDAFIVLSDFQKQVMTQAGLPAHKIHVKPNFYPGMPTVIPWSQRKPYVVFVGRLSHEKGVHSLLKAWRSWGAGAPELRVIGEGPLRSELEKQAVGLPVRFFGQLSSDDAQAQIAGAKLLVLPSEWFETFGMVVIESFANGTPVAVSDIGALPSIVHHGHTGVVFPVAQPVALCEVVRDLWQQQGQLETMGINARLEFETKYTEHANYATLMNIYEAAIAESKRS